MLRRLFREHTGLTLALGFLWFLLACFMLIRPEDPRYPNDNPLIGLLGLLLVLVSFAWTNAGGYQQVQSALKRRALTWGSALADLIVFVILFSIPAAVLAPAYGNYTARARIAGMVAAVSSLKLPIAEAAAEKNSLNGVGSGLKYQPAKNADYLQVGPNGTLIAYNEQHGALLVMTPTLSGQAIAWRCEGYPARLFPSSCRGEAAK